MFFVLAEAGVGRPIPGYLLLVAVADGEQGVLDLEVSTRIARVDEVADWRPEPERPAASTVAPAGRTLGTSSRLLYDVLAAVYDRLGFDEVGDTVFRDLVIARIVEPTSKADSSRVPDDLGADTVSYKTIQRHLATAVTRDYRSIVATRLNGGQTLFVGTTDTNGPNTGGVYRSDDGGATWRRLSGRDGLPNGGGVTDLIPDPTNGNRFFAAIVGPTGPGIYRLDVTGGNTGWQNVTGNLPQAVLQAGRIKLASAGGS